MIDLTKAKYLKKNIILEHLIEVKLIDLQYKDEKLESDDFTKYMQQKADTIEKMDEISATDPEELLMNEIAYERKYFPDMTDEQLTDLVIRHSDESLHTLTGSLRARILADALGTKKDVFWWQIIISFGVDGLSNLSPDDFNKIIEEAKKDPVMKDYAKAANSPVFKVINQIKNKNKPLPTIEELLDRSSQEDGMDM